MKKYCGLLKHIGLIIAFAVNFSNAEETSLWRTGDPWPCKKPKLLRASLNFSARFDGDGYLYEYSLKNLPISEVAVRILELDLRVNSTASVLSMQNIKSVEDIHNRDRVLNDALRVHVSSKKSPEGWEGGADDGGWGTEPYAGLLPGNSISGFSYISKEPPGVREYIVYGYDNKWDFFLQGLYRESPQKALFYLNSKEFMVEANTPLENIGKTIAPVTPPDPFTVSLWTIHMTADAVEARKQKWIKTNKNLTEIKKLIAALNSVDVAKTKTVVKKIEAYVLAEKKKGNLSDEADALVRLNAQYLLRRLEKK